MAHGGVKFLRGSVKDYVTYFLGETGRGCMDLGYYGDGVRWSVSASGATHVGEWTAVSYAAWLSGADPETGESRGSRIAEGELRSGVRGYEYSVNVPKSASIVAALDPQLREVLMAAQLRAAQVGLAALRSRARVRVEGEMVAGKRSQVLVEVDELEVAVFAHEGSREGDPHTHLHVQIGAKALVAGRWRALAGRQMLAALGEWNAVTAAAMATDEEWVRACARRRLTVTEDGGIAQVPRQVERALSSRNTAIEVRREELVEEFRAVQGRGPSAREMVWIDQQAWANTRPKKGERALLGAEQVAELVAAHGGQDVLDRLDARPRARAVDEVDVTAAVTRAVGLANERELLTESSLAAVAATAVAKTGGVATDIARAVEATRLGLRAACTAVDLPAGQTGWMPTGVLTAATRVHEHLVAMAAAAGPQPGVRALDVTGLTPGQMVAAEAVAAGLPVVIEGPAGTGKTTALRAGLVARTAVGLRTFAVAKSAAAASQLGDGWTGVGTADSMLIATGWTKDGATWSPPNEPADPALRGSLLVVDEAAMMDVHTLAAVCEQATRAGQRVILGGDDRQLGAVGAGGGFTVAAMGLETITLAEAKRFTNPEHADLAATWRSGVDVEEIIERVLAAGIVVRHDSEDDARVVLAEAAVDPGAIVMAADNETASAISRLARAERVAHGDVAAGTRRLGKLEEHIGVGDLVQTRSNNKELGVRNRDRWIVQAITEDGGLQVAPIDRNGAVRRDRTVSLPSEYVSSNVHHADAVTVYAAQGATGRVGHAWVDDTWSREQAYVGLTRGRDDNVVHVVAEDDDGVRSLLRSVLTHSDREDAELVAQVTRERLLARQSLAPELAEALTDAGKAGTATGSWGSSMFTTPAPDAPAPPPAKGGPVL